MIKKLLFCFLFISSLSVSAEGLLKLKSGQRTYTEEKTIAASSIMGVQSTYGYISFPKIQSLEDKKILAQHGITLLSYLPTYQYTAKFNTRLSLKKIHELQILGIILPDSSLKIDPSLKHSEILNEIEKEIGFLDVIITAYSEHSKLNLSKNNLLRNLKLLPIKGINKNEIAIRIPKHQLNNIAKINSILYIQPVMGQIEKINYYGQVNHRAAYLNSSLKNLKGTNVAIGVGDGGYTADHLDFNLRLHNLEALPIVSFGNHGVHVAGTVGGSGMINPDNSGMAPNSTIYTGRSSYFVNNLPYVYNKLGIVLSNNSYGNPGTCITFGDYSSTSAFIDNSLFDNLNFLHVFAAGNLGSTNCAPYPNGYGNIYPHYQVSKNILTVGALNYADALAGFSSRGPSKDGRVKPEICGVGVGVISTIPTNAYGSKNGTSMASPGVCGSLGLLVEKYRLLNSNNNPEGALVKVLAMNTADDLGNAQVDFRFGFGRINIARAEEVLSNNYFLKDSVQNGDTNTHLITIPSGVGELKVMIHWREEAPLISSPKALLNNLDLCVINPSSVATYPWKLDTNKANVANLAIRGIDSLNTQEQVTISNPAAGTYKLQVKGSSVVSGNQDYWLTYYYSKQNVKLRYPVGNERIKATGIVTIEYDIENINTGNFTLQYSPDNGSTWTNISTTIAPSSNSLNWTVPNIQSKDVLLRIYHNSSSIGDTNTATFHIMDQPVINLTTCQNSVKLSWTAITGANSYDVFIYNNGQWNYHHNTTATNSIISELIEGNNYWVTIIAKTNTGVESKRAIAKNITVGTGSCNTGIDAGIDQVMSPINGRLLTSTALSATTKFNILIRNFGTTSLTNIPIKYTVNGGAIKSSTWIGTLVSNDTASIFSVAENFLASGDYILKIWTDYAGDVERKNDTIIHIIRQVPNPAITLPHLENFELSPDSIYSSNQFAVDNLDAVDYENSHKNCQLKFTNREDLAYSGKKALLLHKSVQNSTNRSQEITITKNLASFDTALHKIFLKFRFLDANEDKHNGDSVWVRGADTEPWINFYNWWDNKATSGSFQTAFIDISEVLKVNSQNFSTSFQVKFGQEDNGMMRNANDSDGFVLDDFQLLELSNDIAFIELVNPKTGCGLSSADSVVAMITNNGKTVADTVLFKYQLNGGSIQIDTILNIAAGDTIRIASDITVNLSTIGIHSIKSWIEFNNDTYSDNDSSLLLNFRNIKRASSIPSLETFDINNGSFYTEGSNNSWQWGTPSYFKGRAVSGSKVWSTNLSGTHNNNETSTLTSVCYDLSTYGSNEPVLSFHMAYDIEDDFDQLWLEYSDDGINWAKLGNNSGGTNWYNDALNLFDNSFDQWRVHSYTIPTNSLSNKSDIQFRFKFVSDGGLALAGAYIDDIHLFVDTAEIHNTTGITKIKERSTGAGWVHFTSGGKRVASIYDDSKNLDSIDLGVYINSGTERLLYTQYTMNRNWWINPTNKDSGDFKLRLYFDDTEYNSFRLIDDTIYNIFNLGITKYDGLNEDHDFLNDTFGATNSLIYIPNNLLSIVPYNTGYYIEFRIDSFSEFWINGGTPTHIIPLPIDWIYASGLKQQNNNLIRWKSSFTENVLYYNLYKKCANGINGFKLISKIPHIPFQQEYQYFDKNNRECDNSIYQIGAVFNDGKIDKSPFVIIKAVEKSFKVFPNPFNEELYVFFNATNSPFSIKLINTNGQIIRDLQFKRGTKTTKINLNKIPAGVYFMEYQNNNTVENIKVIKQ